MQESLPVPPALFNGLRFSRLQRTVISIVNVVYPHLHHHGWEVGLQEPHDARMVYFDAIDGDSTTQGGVFYI